MPKFIDLSGQRFGRLTVIERAAENLSGKPAWHCRCDCGNHVTVRGNALHTGNTMSCGCLRVDTCKGTKTTHGSSKTRLFYTYNNMKHRCYYKKSKDYENYGGRGICVCDEWLHSFETFKKWALENGYSEGLSIDRIDPNGNYCPENCRWTTMQVQGKNKRMCYLTFNGETKTREEWSMVTGISRANIADRLHKGWSIERTLTEPVHNNEKDG